MEQTIAEWEWVAQVSLLRPGFLLASGSQPEHRGLSLPGTQVPIQGTRSSGSPPSLGIPTDWTER
jgi:hypothetical protein